MSTNLLAPSFDWVLPNNWDYQIILHSYYTDGDLSAGNLTIDNTMVECIRIKKRYKGEFDWKTIYEKDYDGTNNSVDALNISYYDFLEPNRTDIEYSYTVILKAGNDGTFVETDPIINSVYSDFLSYFIVGQDKSYPILYNINNSVQRNRETATVVSPGRKYPYVINNGIADYYSGSFTATLFLHDEDYLPNTNNAYKYRNSFDDFIVDGQAKILKTLEGDIYLIAITGSGVTRQNNGNHYKNIGQSFDWVEVGDPNNTGDLYDNGFINTDIDREV